mgnify:CR=1 FL=1
MFADANGSPAAPDESALGRLPAAYSLGFAVQHVLPHPSAIESPTVQSGAIGATPSVSQIWRPDQT